MDQGPRFLQSSSFAAAAAPIVSARYSTIVSSVQPPMGKRLADVALLVHEDEPRLLALAVDDLELVVLTGLVLDEARDDGVVLELSLADF